MDDFFDRLIKYPRNGLTDQMIKIIDANNNGHLVFGEFLELVTQFSCFETKELLQYFFYVLDPHKTGLVHKVELRHFIENMWDHRVNTNVKIGLDWLEKFDQGEGMVSFPQLYAMQRKYPMVFDPLYQLQVNIINNTLGEVWWESHKASLSDIKEKIKADELKALLEQEKAEARANELVSDEMILNRMGYLRYYLMPWQREFEKQRILKIAALEQELDAMKEKRMERAY